MRSESDLLRDKKLALATFVEIALMVQQVVVKPVVEMDHVIIGKVE